MAHNSIAGWIWLGLAFGGIGYAAVQGLEKGRVAQEEVAKQKELATVEALNQKMAKAIYEARKQNLDGAIELLEELAAEHPNRSAVFLNLGIAHRANKNPDKAMVALEHAAELSPKDWDIVAEQATILAEEGKITDAIKKADSIPVRQGHMLERLRADPAWAEATVSPELLALRSKHGMGVDGVGETGETGRKEIERQKKSYPIGEQNDHAGHPHD